MLSKLSNDLKQYLIITANYWAFTLTDGALRMLVVLYFHQLGYAPLEIAFLFLFYEFFGVITNLIGGWLGARLGLNQTMNIGLGLQLFALSMLTVPSSLLSVFWVMAAQALSGIAKDLNKMSAKSAIKLLVPEDASSTLFKWVALLTGSKNTLKGIGFFLGAVLLAAFGFRNTIVIMLLALSLVFIASLLLLQGELGRASNKPRFTAMFAKNSDINRLSLARLFLFAARDVWFVVALPVYFSSQYQWTHWQVGAFMAVWIIAYGIVQTQAPSLFKTRHDGRAALLWVSLLAVIPLVIIASAAPANPATNIEFPVSYLITGLLIFGLVFAINSSLHSFLIVDYADREAVSMDVGFYYMANATGRLFGTLLSGLIFQLYGLAACLLCSAMLLICAASVSWFLPRQTLHKPPSRIP